MWVLLDIHTYIRTVHICGVYRTKLFHSTYNWADLWHNYILYGISFTNYNNPSVFVFLIIHASQSIFLRVCLLSVMRVLYCTTMVFDKKVWRVEKSLNFDENVG